MFPVTLLQAADNSPLAGMPAYAQYLVIGAAAVVAGYLAYRSILADASGTAVGTWVLGLAVSAVPGYLGWGVDGAVGTIILYLIVASAAVLYYIPREGEIPLWFVLLLAGFTAAYAVFGGTVGTFAVAAGVTLFGGMKVLTSRELVHATVWLAAALLGVGLTFLSVGAQFLFLIQILVYIGAVVTLFLFTVMLTIPAEESHFLDELDLPPGVVIESVQDLGEVTPGRGAGPMKGFDHPRKPLRVPDTMYGVALSDNVYGTENTPKKGHGTEEGS